MKVKKPDIYEKRKLARRRLKPQAMMLLVSFVLVFIAFLLISYKEKLPLKEMTKMYIFQLSLIVFFLFILIGYLLILNLIKPRTILYHDLENIYYYKTARKEIIIPFYDINNIKAKVKSKKKNKQIYGTLTLRTPQARYKIKNVLDVKEIEKQIFSLLERLQAYLEGKKEGQASKV